MKNKNALVSLVFATGSVVALVMILGNLESPSSSPSTANTVVSPGSSVNSTVAPAGQGKVVSTGTSYEYEYDFDDEKEDEKEDEKDNNEHNGKHDGKGKKYGKNTSIPSTPSTLDSTQIQKNPKQSTTQAS